MSFIWPQLLLGLFLLPLGILAHRVIGRRRRRAMERSGLGIGPGMVRRTSGARARVPAVLVVGGLALMLIALARPQATVDLPRDEGTVILAFDVSGSMAADDVKPTRMEAAKAAAQDFVARVPPGVVIGVVAFSDAGLSVQAPTNDRDVVATAIGRLKPERGTSLAQGITASLAAIDLAEHGPSTDYYSNRSAAPTATPTPVAPASDASAVIVLLTDGENTQPPDPAAAAQAAADRGVRIATVGIGSASGADLEIDGFKVHSQLDSAALEQIATVTGGTYYAAEDEGNLRQVYDDLGTRLVVRPQAIEITAILAGVSALLLAAGGVGSLLWLGRLP